MQDQNKSTSKNIKSSKVSRSETDSAGDKKFLTYTSIGLIVAGIAISPRDTNVQFDFVSFVMYCLLVLASLIVLFLLTKDRNDILSPFIETESKLDERETQHRSEIYSKAYFVLTLLFAGVVFFPGIVPYAFTSQGAIFVFLGVCLLPVWINNIGGTVVKFWKS